jgi:CspA family cold shock protein
METEVISKPVYHIGKYKKTNKMNKGTVKFFNEAKGFGFIKGENGEEVFVHASGLIHEIQENDQVTYDVQDGKKGLNAVNVSRV